MCRYTSMRSSYSELLLAELTTKTSGPFYAWPLPRSQLQGEELGTGGPGTARRRRRWRT